jgi:YD repeat-containing protein
MGRNTTGLGEFTQMFAHNTIGQVTSTSYNDKAQLFYTYNIIGGLNQVCDNGACKAGAGEIYYEVDPYTGYNEFGSLLEEKYGNGVKGTYEYYPKSHRMSKKVTALDANKYSDRKYTYDAQANITSLLDQAGSLGAVSIKTAKYDNANRLTQTELTGAPAIKMEYDALGNTLKNSTVYGDKTYIYGSSRPHAVTQIHDEQFSYDANGNMLSDAYRTMSYDTLNQLAKVVMKNGSVVEYGYDYAGTRVFKKVSTNDTYGKAVENTTHYLGNAIEIRPSSDEMILHVYAEGKLVATR